MIVQPSERGEWWSVDDDCFYCHESIAATEIAVIWAGLHTAILHPTCAEKLGAHLIADAREALLASGSKPWDHRAARVVRAALQAQEWKD